MQDDQAVDEAEAGAMQNSSFRNPADIATIAQLQEENEQLR